MTNSIKNLIEEVKFNIPKDKEDKRRLLIDLENNVGLILKEDSGFFIVRKYKEKSYQAGIQAGRKEKDEDWIKKNYSEPLYDGTAMEIARKAERDRIRDRIIDYLKKIVWTEKDIEYFLKTVIK